MSVLILETLMAFISRSLVNIEHKKPRISSRGVSYFIFGVWSLAFGVWCLVFGVL